MTLQEELRENLELIHAIWATTKDRDDTAGTKLLNGYMKLINQHVAEVIGEDAEIMRSWYGLTQQDAYEDAKREVEYHNQLLSEQRLRAGI